MTSSQSPGAIAGVVRGLRLASDVEFVLDHGAVRVEAVAESRPSGLAAPAPPPEVLAERARSGLRHPPVQFARILSNRAVLTAVGLAVALEAAAVGERQQYAPQFVRCERAIERFGAQPQGIEVPRSCAHFLALGEQPAPAQEPRDTTAAAQHPVAVAPRTPLAPPLGGVRRTALRAAPVGVDEDAASDEFHGFGRLAVVQAVECPANAVGTEVEAETQHLPTLG